MIQPPPGIHSRRSGPASESIVWTGDNADQVELFLGRYFESWLPSTQQILYRIGGAEHLADRGETLTLTIGCTR